MQLIKVGADPELAIYDGKGSVLMACGKIPGTKKKPFAIEGSKTGLHIQEDGVSLEFNMKEIEIKGFYKQTLAAMGELKKLIPTYFGAGADYYITDGYAFKEAELAKFPQAMKFGCDPDYQAYKRGEKRAALDASALGSVRLYGGHIHIGYDREKCPVPDWAIVQGMEALGYALLVAEGLDPQRSRRKFYGVPGLYRPKSYGLEYRTPSNFWCVQPQRIETMLNIAQAIVNKPGKYQELYQRINFDRVYDIVSESKRKPGVTFMDDMYDLQEELLNAPVEELS